MELSCDKIRAGFTLNCDEACTEKQQLEQKIAEDAKRAKMELEMEKRRQELEEFEKKFGKKKYKERKKIVVEEKSNNLHIWIGGAVGVVILAAFLYFLVIAQ